MTVRFPKWLIEEPFDVSYDPKGKLRGFGAKWKVTLFDPQMPVRYSKQGQSLAQAAKLAAKLRTDTIRADGFTK